MDSGLTISSTIDSSLEAVDDAEEAVRRFAADAGFPEADLYFIGLAAREVLVNAVMHGNRFDPEKKVQVRLSRNEGGIAIEVIDEGEGFRLEDVPDPRVGANRERRSGRGLMMAREIMDEIAVDRNIVRMAKKRQGPQMNTDKHR